MRYIIDSYAWIEYFEGSEKGKKAAKIIDDSSILLVTLESTVAEIFSWCNEKGMNPSNVFNDIRGMSVISPINLTNWIVAAAIRDAKKRAIKDFGLMDSLLIAKQEELKARVVTGDKHFKDLKNVIYIGD